MEQITYVVYQIARAATLYDVAEIVILDIPQDTTEMSQKKTFKETKLSQDTLLIASLLQFFITPPYLRKAVFQNKLESFKTAKQLPKLPNLPFMQKDRKCENFREGLSIPCARPKKRKNAQGKVMKQKSVKTRFVNIGEDKVLQLAKGQEVPANARITVDIKEKKIVSPKEAYGVIGAKAAFGYHVRAARNLNALFTESSFEDGYSSSVYVPVGEFMNSKPVEAASFAGGSKEGVLVLFAKPSELELCFKNDKAGFEGLESVFQLMDSKIDVPQGMRVEDGVLVGLTKVN